MKCPLYPLNMSLSHLELNVPWPKVLWMLCKEDFSHHCHCGTQCVLSQTIRCTEHMERNSVNGWWHFHHYYCYIPFQPLLVHVVQPKVLVASKDYHMVVTTNIHLNRMAR